MTTTTQYYPIGKVAEYLKVSVSTAHRYLEKFATPYTEDPDLDYPPSKARRLYADVDVDRLAVQVAAANDAANEYGTSVEIAERYGWSRTYVVNACRRGDIVGARVNNRWFIHFGSAEHWYQHGAHNGPGAQDRAFKELHRREEQVVQEQVVHDEPSPGECVYGECENPGTVKTAFGTFCDEHVPAI